MPKLSLRARSSQTGHRLVVVVGLALCIFGVYGLSQRYRATHNPRPLPPTSAVVSGSVGRPDETPIKPDAPYKTAANQPRLIRLPTIGAEGFIQMVGLTKTGAVGTPTNISLAGWYSLEKKPGDVGVSLIDGHVQGYYNPGIFKNLAKLKAGAEFTVEFGDLSVRKFEVVSVTSYPVADVVKQLFRQQAGINKQVNIITCDGAYDPQTKQYENRVLVVSKRLD